jgi:lipoyl(octanoyl) transferase
VPLSFIGNDLHRYLEFLENTIIETLTQLKIQAYSRKGLRGVWVGTKKIAAIGIAVRKWVSFHGCSINVCHEDLRGFHAINPCGMDIEVTSVESELRHAVDITTVRNLFVRRFIHDYRQITASGREYLESNRVVLVRE